MLAYHHLTQRQNLLAFPVPQKWRRRCPSLWAGFGLSDEYSEKVVYESIFFLMNRGNFSFSEAYSLPVALREWFVNRIVKDLTSEDE